jgi:transcription elongation factor Elf1
MPTRDRERDAFLEDEEEEDARKNATVGTRRRFSEFECPACSANNPFDEFGNNDEVLCNWCGLQFKAVVDDEGTLRLKEL